MSTTPTDSTRAAYADSEYQQVHINLFSKSIISPPPKVLPPGVSQATFDKALSEWRNVLGKENVYGQNEIGEYIDPYEVNESTPVAERKIPSGAVTPTTVEQAKKVLEIANKYKIPLWTFSRGKNLGYGGPAPRLNGSVALDLHKLNKIIEVNEEFSYAVVEPGVTFTDLYNYCKEHNLRVWPSVPSLGWGSVVGNTVDRGTGFLPTATHYQNMAGLEILLADGDIVRTGQFGITNSASAHISKFTFGPSIEGLFLQSNLGIVTKLGIWLTPQPEAYASCFLQAPEFEDIEVIADTLGSLRQSGIIPNTIFISNVIEVISMIKKRIEFWPHESLIPENVLKQIMKEFNLGYWNAKFGLFGPERIIKAQLDEITDVLKKNAPTFTFNYEVFSSKDGAPLEAHKIPEPHGGPFVGVPTLWSLPMVKFRLPKDESNSISGHGDFSSIIPSNGKAALAWCQASKRICEAHGFDLFCDFFMHERHLIFVNFQPFDKTVPRHRKEIQAIFADMYVEAKKRGFSNYRSHVNHMDPIAELYDFNDHAYRRFVDKLKNTLDPNGILSPGKMGIWGSQHSQHRDIGFFERTLTTPGATKL